MEEKEALAILRSLIFDKPSKEDTRLHSLSQGASFLLLYLYDHDGCLVSAGEIAGAAEISSARVASLVNSLEKKGYVCRLKSTRDTRITYVIETEEGKKEIEKKIADGVRRIRYLSDRLGEETLRTYFATLERIKALLSQYEPTDN